MKEIKEIIAILEKEKGYLRREYGVKDIGIFGSRLKGESSEESDLDVLIDFEREIGLIKFMKIENYLSEVLGVRVDLVMKDALKPHIGKEILREVRYL